MKIISCRREPYLPLPSNLANSDNNKININNNNRKCKFLHKYK